MTKDPKGPRGNKGKFDPDSVEELTDAEIEKVQGGLSNEKSIITSSYVQRSDPKHPGTTTVYGGTKTYIDIYGVKESGEKPGGS